MDSNNFRYKTYNVKRLIERLRSWPEAIEYAQEQIIRNLAEGSIAKNLCDIVSFLTFHNRPISRIAPKDVKEWLIWTKTSNLKESTFTRRLTIVKSFLKRIGREDLASVIPKVNFTYEPKNISLSGSDIDTLIKSCRNDLERGLIHMLKDTGCRIGELLTLRKKDVVFDDLGIYIIVDGKTGKRAVRLVDSIKYCKKLWKKLDNDNDLLFNGKTYHWAYWIFRRASKKLGKNVHPHIFRHLKATKMLRKYSEAIVKKYMGWSPHSKMTMFYNHISPRDVDAAILHRI